jgi:hypothetical protein
MFGMSISPLTGPPDNPATAHPVFAAGADADGWDCKGFLYLEGDVPMMIHDHSGPAAVYSWKRLSGPVLWIYRLRPRRKPTVLYAHPGWTPPRGG